MIDSQASRISSFKGTVQQSNVGLVTCLDEKDLGDIQKALSSEPEPIKAAGINPPVQIIDAFANKLPPGTPYEYLLQRVRNEVSIHPRYFLCNEKDQRHIASLLDTIPGLSVIQCCVLTAAPVDVRTEVGKNIVKALARCMAMRRAVTIADIPEIPLDVLDEPISGDRTYLVNLELLHKSLILFLWLAYRFSNIFMDKEMAIHAKTLVEEKINTTLLEFSANPKLRKKLLRMRQVPRAQDASEESSGKSEQKAPGTAETGLMEEDLSEPVNDLSVLPVDWKNRSTGEDISLDTGPLETRHHTASPP